MIKVTQTARKFAATTKRGMYERARFEAIVIEGGKTVAKTENHETYDDAYGAAMKLRKAYRLTLAAE